MKSKGNILLEVLIALMLFSCIITVTINNKSIKDINIDINKNNIVYCVEDILCYAKKYSYYSKEGSYLYFDTDELILKNNKDKILKQYKLNSNTQVFVNNKKILKINEDGYIESDTIYIKVNNNLAYKITIRPGGNIITTW